MANPFKIVLNPRGNAGALFDVDAGETCFLEVKFDYLFEFDCAELLNSTGTGLGITIEEQEQITTLETTISETQDQITVYEEQITTCEEDINNALRLIGGTKDNILISNLNNIISTCETTIEGATTNIETLTTTVETLTEQLDSVTTFVSEVGACTGITQALETLDVCWTIEKSIIGENGNEVVTVFEEPLFKITNLVEHINGNQNTGLLFVNNAGGNCDTVNQIIKNELGEGCEVVSASTFNSSWLNETHIITDVDTIAAITGEEIKISLKVKDCCVDFGILLDRIELNKRCTKLEKEDIFITKTPSFELERVCDNKKSWVANDTQTDRDFEVKLRETEYSANHHKAVVNSKEVDLDISPATAIETDIQCFIKDNPCLLDPLSGATIYSATCPTLINVSGDCFISSGTCEPQCGDISSIDFNNLLSTPVSATTTVKEFARLISSELIDVKNRKTLSGYPTIRSLYDRYVNSGDYCGIDSAAFDYCQMADFTDLIGTYWVDLIEQVIPSTAIWGSTYVYKNTIFDAQKFKYKSYNLHLCDVPLTGCGSDIIASNGNVEVLQTELGISSSTNVGLIAEKELECANLQASLDEDLKAAISREEYNQISNRLELCERELAQLIQDDLLCEDITSSGDTCNGVYIFERDYSSEFRGTVSVVGPDADEILGIPKSDVRQIMVINEK